MFSIPRWMFTFHSQMARRIWQLIRTRRENELDAIQAIAARDLGFTVRVFEEDSLGFDLKW